MSIPHRAPVQDAIRKDVGDPRSFLRRHVEIRWEHSRQTLLKFLSETCGLGAPAIPTDLAYQIYDELLIASAATERADGRWVWLPLKD